MEKNNEKPKNKMNLGKIRIIFSSMMLFVLFLAEIYLMVHSSEYFIGFVTVTVLLIAVMYILIASILQINYEKEQRRQEEIGELYNSEKTSYMLMHKSFQELNERVAYVEDNLQTPTEEIIAAQKAIAKVTISRNKENSDALMNSNDKLLERFFNFEDLLANNNANLLEQQKQIIDQASREIILKQQESIAKLKEIELSIKNEILQSVNTITSAQPKVIMAGQTVVEPKTVSISNVIEEAGTVEEPISLDELLADESDIGILDDSVETEQEIPSMDESLKEEAFNDSMIESEIAEEDSEEVMEEELGFEEESVMEEEPVIEEELGFEEEPVIEEKPVLEEEPVIEEPIIEESIMEIPVEEEKPATPDLSDPNKMLTPDDIAALLANVGTAEPTAEAEPVEEEPVMEEELGFEEEPVMEEELGYEEEPMIEEELGFEEEPVMEESTIEESVIEEPVIDAQVIEEPTIEAPVEEEKLPMPDLSDPNKMLTPDDIAALLANM